ncbi:MAG: phage holin family protein [Betaproteobacteria bacterium]
MSSPPAAGIFGSLRRLVADLRDLAIVRLELLGTELELEKRRWLVTLCLAAFALVCLALGLVMASVAVLLVFWDSYRIAAAVGLALCFGLAGAVLLWTAMRKMHSPRGAFHASITELRRDVGVSAPNRTP